MQCPKADLCSRSSKEPHLTGIAWVRGRVVGDEVYEVKEGPVGHCEDLGFHSKSLGSCCRVLSSSVT